MVAFMSTSVSAQGHCNGIGIGYTMRWREKKMSQNVAPRIIMNRFGYMLKNCIYDSHAATRIARARIQPQKMH